LTNPNCTDERRKRKGKEKRELSILKVDELLESIKQNRMKVKERGKQKKDGNKDSKGKEG